jgi:transcription elongation factor Elf1
MLTRLFHRLTAWLSDHWLNIRVQWHADRADRMREDQEPYYRPVYSLLSDPADRPSCEINAVRYLKPPIANAAAHCVNCGHRGTVLVPDGTEPAELDGQILDMLECPRCGLYTMCSD